MSPPHLLGGPARPEKRPESPRLTDDARGWLALMAFAGAAIAFSWTLYAAVGPGAGPAGQALRTLATFGPSLAAITVVASKQRREGVRRLLSPLTRWSIGWRWYAGTLAGPPLVMGTGAAVYVLFGGSLGATENDPAMWWTIPLIFAVVLVAGGPLGEELGWRGFALPRAQDLIGPVPATMLLGAVWALWHLPWLTDPGSVQYEIPWPVFVGQIMVTSVFYTWVVNRTASLVPALLLHASFNTSVGLMPVLPSATAPAGPAVIALALGTTAAAILLVRTRGRLGQSAVAD